MRVFCDRCGQELDAPGALLFGPPTPSLGMGVIKQHLCKRCYEAVRDWMRARLEQTR